MDRSETSPLVSVVIPTHNRAHLIGRAVQSVLDQTMPDWECLIVDDASTDGTEEVVRKLRDPRVRYLRHPVNRGGSAARNTGIEAARGPYVAFLDSDDEWLPPKLERQIERFRTTELTKVGLIYTGFTTVRGNEETGPVQPRGRGWMFDELLRANVIGSTSLVIAPREVLREVGGFDESLPAKQDVDLWLRIAREHQIDFVPEPLVRMHQGRGERRITSDGAGRVLARERFFRKYARELREAGIAHQYHRRTGRICLRHVRDPGAARRWYLEAVRERPLDLAAYGLLAFALLPLRVQDGLVALQRVGESGASEKDPQDAVTS